jgi:hypothetical protein
VVEREASQKKERETMMTPEDVKARREQNQEEGKQKAGRKLPTLRRTGDEVATDPKPAPKKK